MQIWAESGKSALPICNYSQILYQFLTFTQNLKRSHRKQNRIVFDASLGNQRGIFALNQTIHSTGKVSYARFHMLFGFLPASGRESVPLVCPHCRL